MNRYGLLQEIGDKIAVVAPLGDFDPNDVERCSERLLKLLDEVDELSRDLEEATNVVSLDAMHALTRIAKLVKESLASCSHAKEAVLYVALAKLLGFHPRIISGKEVWSGRWRIVCVAGKKCVRIDESTTA